MSKNTPIDNVESRLRDLEIKQSGLDSRVTVSTNVFYAVSLLLAVLGSVAGYNLLTYQRFEVAKINVHKMLVSDLEKDMGNFFNSYVVRSPDDDQLNRWKDLNKQVEYLDSMGVSDERFPDIKSIFSILGDVFQYGHKLPQKQNEDINRLSLFGKDVFVQSRAICLRAMLKLSQENWKYNTATEQDYLEALKKDAGVGPAWTGLGILYGSDMEDKLKAGSVDKALELSRLALTCLDRGFDLDKTLVGFVKYQNNRIWCQGLLFEAMLNKKVDKALFASLVDAQSPEIFIEHSLRELEFGKKHQPDSLAQFETFAELEGLAVIYFSEYLPNTGEASKNAVTYAKNSADDYRIAIRKGLFKKVNISDAIQYFREDTAMRLVRNTYASAIEKEIGQHTLQ